VRIARFSRDDNVAYGVVQEVSPDGRDGGAVGPDTEGLLIAELQGHNPDIAEAFMNKDKEVKIGDEIISPKGQLLTLDANKAARWIAG